MKDRYKNNVDETLLLDIKYNEARNEFIKLTNLAIAGDKTATAGLLKASNKMMDLAKKFILIASKEREAQLLSELGRDE